MAQWRVVDLLGFGGDVSYSRGRLVLRRDCDEIGQIPLAETAVILVGLKAALGPSVLQKCCDFGVMLIPCQWAGTPVGAVAPWSGHTRVGARQLAQATLSLPRRKSAWAQIIRAKVIGQARTMELFDERISSDLLGLARSVRSGDPQNVEAQAARKYWARMFRGASCGRDPGSGLGRNGLLDYGYTVMRGYCLRAVISAGLWPGLGVFHQGRGNPFHLVDDLIEPFRPALDAVVWMMKPDASLDERSVKHAVVAAADQVFSDSGLTISSEMTSLAQRFGNYVEGDAARLEVPVWKGGFLQSW